MFGHEAETFVKGKVRANQPVVTVRQYHVIRHSVERGLPFPPRDFGFAARGLFAVEKPGVEFAYVLGFYARAATTVLTLDPEELQNAGWFSRDFLRGPHDPDRFRLPRADSIARRLMQDWIDAG